MELEEILDQNMLDKYFGELEDSRQDYKVRHGMTEILTIFLCGASADIRSVYGILQFARIKEKWLREVVHLPLENGLPSYDTLRRVIGMIDPKKFQALFIKWIETVMEIPEGSYISIDGKTLRGSGNEEKGIAPLHLLSAYCHENGIVIGQTNCDEKENEITECPKFLDSLKIKGSTVTTDAMMCQRKIAGKIREKKCDYVLALKQNHPNTFKDAMELFNGEELGHWKKTETFDKGHGRIEKRTYILDSDIKWFADQREWRDLKSFGCCVCETQCKGRTSVMKRYFLTSLEDVGKFSQAVRNHWAIENNLHWCLDVTFSDDGCQILDRNAAENLAIIRRIVYNRIKQLSEWDSLAMGKRACTLDDDFRYRILFSK